MCNEPTIDTLFSLFDANIIHAFGMDNIEAVPLYFQMHIDMFEQVYTTHTSLLQSPVFYKKLSCMQLVFVTDTFLLQLFFIISCRLKKTSKSNVADANWKKGHVFFISW